MIFIGTVNGILRQFGCGHSLSDLTAHQVSTVTAIVLFLLYTWLPSHRWPFVYCRRAIAVGLVRLGLPVGFEFPYGHYVANHSCGRLLRYYSILGGRLWIPALLTAAIAP